MKPRWIAYFFFLAIVMGICCIRCLFKRTPDSVEWLTAVKLVVNTRITTNHLQSPVMAAPIMSWGLPSMENLVGKYSMVEIPQGARIELTNLTLFPQVSKLEGTALISLSDQKLGSLALHLNAGTRVFVAASETTNILGPFKVEAVLGSADSATVLIRVATSEAQGVQKLSKPAVLLAELSD